MVGYGRLRYDRTWDQPAAITSGRVCLRPLNEPHCDKIFVHVDIKDGMQGETKANDALRYKSYAERKVQCSVEDESHKAWIKGKSQM